MNNTKVKKRKQNKKRQNEIEEGGMRAKSDKSVSTPKPMYQLWKCTSDHLSLS